MSKVTLQFSCQNDLGSDAIRFFEHGGGYSHVDIVTDQGNLLGARSDVVAGVPAGVQIRPFNYTTFLRFLPVSIECTPEQKAAFDGFLIAQLGKPYDTTAILGFVANRDWRTPDAWFCSELAGAALEQSKIFPFNLAAPANKLAPTDLLLACSVLTNISGP